MCLSFFFEMCKQNQLAALGSYEKRFLLIDISKIWLTYQVNFSALNFTCSHFCQVKPFNGTSRTHTSNMQMRQSLWGQMFWFEVCVTGKCTQGQGASENCRRRRRVFLWSYTEFGRGISDSPVSKVHLNWTAWNIEVDVVSYCVGNVLFFGLALSFLLWIRSFTRKSVY